MNQRNNAKMIWSIVIVNCLLYGSILIDTVIGTHLFQNHDNALAISMFARNLVLSVIAIVLYKRLLRDDFKSTGLRTFLKQWGISFATAILLQIIAGYLYSQLSGTAGTENQMEVDGGKSAGKVIAGVGGTAGIFTGLGLFCAGVATFNPVMAAAGAGLMCTGTATAVQYYN